MITQRETRTVVTVVPCLFFSSAGFTRHIAGSAVPYMHHNALYRCMLVTFFFPEQNIYVALVLVGKSCNGSYSHKRETIKPLVLIVTLFGH